MLTGWIAAVIGIIIVVFSLNSLIREIRKGGIPNMEDQSFSDTFHELLNRADQFGENLDDINQTFYETVERLEKRIEVLERRNSVQGNSKRTNMEIKAYQELSPRTESTPESLLSEPRYQASDASYMAAEIKRLLNEGKDSQQVARELNLGVGEVELIRRLKTNHQKNEKTVGNTPKSPT